MPPCPAFPSCGFSHQPRSCVVSSGGERSKPQQGMPGLMISRRSMLAGLAGLTGPSLAGCSGRQPAPPAPASMPQAPPPGPAIASSSWRPAVAGLDAVIDISHNVTVGDFTLVRQSNILGVIHKATEGGDWIDPSYASRCTQAESVGLLWGAYHVGTRQYSGAEQAAAFVSTVR